MVAATQGDRVTIEEVSLLPDAHYVTSLVKQNLSMRIALCEWIDNALDAGATSVAISFGRARSNGGGAEHVSVVDNGRGKADLLALARLGQHDRTDTTRSGINGCGAKDAALWMGGAHSVFTITSVHGGLRRSFAVDWSYVAKNGWRNPAPAPPTSAGLDPTGTEIVVAPVIRRVADGPGWQRLVDELAYTYTPAIKRGIQISIRAKKRGSETATLSAWKLPALQPGHVDREISVAGKKARVYAGIVREGEPNPRPGLSYLHGFRVITMASALGCGAYSVARVAGFVEIDDSWERNKNKDGIQRPDELYDEVLRVLEDLLRRAEQQGSQLRSEKFAKAVEGLINASLNDAKARRDRGESKGTKEPKETGRKHRDAAKKQRGETMSSRRYGAVRIDFNELGDDAGIGKLQSNGVIVLNLDNPAIAHAKKSENVLAVACAACALVASDRAIRGEKSTLSIRFDHDREDADAIERFALTLGGLLSSSTAIDGKNVVEEATG
jgi:hypothetical protein